MKTKVHALTTPATKRTASHTGSRWPTPIAAVSNTVATSPTRTMRAGATRSAAQLTAPTK